MENETITIPASITLPKEDFNNFVERIGYFEEIEDPNDNTKLIPNPESKIEFAQRKFKDDICMPWFLQFQFNQIDVDINDAREKQRKEAKQAAYDAFSPLVKIG